MITCSLCRDYEAVKVSPHGTPMCNACSEAYELGQEHVDIRCEPYTDDEDYDCMYCLGPMPVTHRLLFPLDPQLVCDACFKAFSEGQTHECGYLARIVSFTATGHEVDRYGMSQWLIVSVIDDTGHQYTLPEPQPIPEATQ